jgi:SAM-dependent methyltransferase
MLVCAAVASAAYVMSPPRLRRRHFRVPFSPTCDVIDDIAAAAISDEEKEMINAVAGPRAAGYGEMLPQGMRALIAATRLRSNDTFVDVGSGSGKLVLQAAADAGVARSVGLELSPTRHAMAQRALDERSAQGAAFAPNVAFILGDALENPQALEVTPLLRTSPQDPSPLLTPLLASPLPSS